MIFTGENNAMISSGIAAVAGWRQAMMLIACPSLHPVRMFVRRVVCCPGMSTIGSLRAC